MTRSMGFTAVAILASAISPVGCSQAPAPPSAPAKATATKASDHGHSHDDDHHSHEAGPHGGTIADWGGGKYHVEFTVDHDKKEAVIYVLGTDEKTPAPIKASDGKLLLTISEPAFQVELVARPLSGEAEGTSSCYGGTHDSLGVVREFAGTISGEVGGTPFAGDFAECDHDHK
ncbi:MAG: hypothetical protein WCC69_08300 [Pirellulales bacterium]